MIIIILIACDRMCPAYITYLGDCAHKGVFRHAAVLKSNKYPSISHPILGGEYGLEL